MSLVSSLQDAFVAVANRINLLSARIPATQRITITVPHQSICHRVVVPAIGTTPSSFARAWLSTSSTNLDNTPEWLEGISIEASCITDAIELYFNFTYPESGQITIDYQVWQT